MHFLRNHIINPNKEIINQFLDTSHKNEEKIYNNSFNKIIKESAIINRKIIGDGNCHFRSLSDFLNIQKIIKIILETVYIII